MEYEVYRTALLNFQQGWEFALWFFERIASESLTSLFFKERREPFAQGCSFVKSNERDSLMVALFLKSDESKSLTVAL